MSRKWQVCLFALASFILLYGSCAGCLRVQNDLLATFMYLDDILKDAREGKLAGKRDDELRSMLMECSNHLGQHSDTWASNQIPNAIKAIREELLSRQLAKEHRESIAEQQKLHLQATEHGGKLHTETMDELNEIKTSVDRLGHPRWIDWAILAVGAIAAIAAVVSLFLKH